jgi:hypothetical protein
MPTSEEVSDQPPDFMELFDRNFSECEDYVYRRGIALYTIGLPIWDVQYRKRGEKRWSS